MIQHPIQALMSRTGSFPLSVAYHLLEKYAGGTSVVFDPFCGKGTVLLAARLLGFPAYGLDVAPEAVVCSTAKMSSVTLDGVLRYIRSLPTSRPHHAPVPRSVRPFFHPLTLRQLLALRDRLARDISSTRGHIARSANFTLAALLGILHGHASFSLSIPCAHAYSMSPSYVTRFAQRHGLKKPHRDVKHCLAVKITRCLDQPLPPPVPFAVRRGPADRAVVIFPELVGKVDLILTSPPYLNAQTYAKDNWLRLWFLGYDAKLLRKEYLETQDIPRYSAYMVAVFQQLGHLLRPGGRLICIAGDARIRHRSQTSRLPLVFRTGEALAAIIEDSRIGLEVEQTLEHQIASNQRYFHALSASNGHAKRHLVERVVIASKPRTPKRGRR